MDFLTAVLGLLMELALLLEKNLLVHAPLAETIVIPLGLRGTPSAWEAGIQEKVFGWWTTTLVISNS